MNEKKGWGSTVVGWFIEKEDQPHDTADAIAAATDESYAMTDEQAAALISSAAGESGSAQAQSSPAPAGATIKPPALVGGKVDFESVFESAGVDKEERERVAKAIALVHSLPAETDVTVKKQIVEASLKAFGVPIEKIIEAGAAEIQALEFYIRGGAGDTEKLLGESAERIARYEEEIKNIRRIMEERVQEQQAVVKLCNEQKLEVQQILEFFGQDAVARVVKASPKLHDPKDEQAPSN